MKKKTLHIFSGFLGLLVIALAPAFAFDVNLGGDAADYFYLENNFIDPATGLYTPEDAYNLLNFKPGLLFSQGSMFSGYILGDISWLHSFNRHDEINDYDAEVTQAFFTLSGNKNSLQIGLQPFQLGNGFILFNEEPGITLAYAPSMQYYIKAEAAGIMTSSAIAAMTLGYKPGFLEYIEIFGVWYRDTDKKLSELLNTIPEIVVSDSRIINNKGDLFWFGANGNLLLGPFYLSGCMIYQFGSPTITIETPILWTGGVLHNYSDQSVSVSSGLLDLQIDYTFSPDASMGLIFFYTSGDISPTDRNINTFLSPIPFNTRTGIFFSGFGLIDGSDRIELVGTRWTGVIAPGINFNVRLIENLTLDAILTLIYPEETHTSAQQMYGWEIDSLISYNILKKIDLIFEADIFHYGDFFKTLENSVPKAATRIMIGINGYF